MEKQLSIRALSASANLSLEENIHLFRALRAMGKHRKAEAYVGQLVIQAGGGDDEKRDLEIMRGALCMLRESEKKATMDSTGEFRVDPASVKLPKIFHGVWLRDFLQAKRHRKIAMMTLDSSFLEEIMDVADFTIFFDDLNPSDERLIRMAARYFYGERISTEDAVLITKHLHQSWKYFQPGRPFALALKMMKSKLSPKKTADQELGSLQLAENYPGLIDDINNEMEHEAVEAEERERSFQKECKQQQVELLADAVETARAAKKAEQDKIKYSGTEGWKKVDIDRFEALQQSFVSFATPTLHDLSGYGEAGEWGLKLAEDLSAYAMGDLEWDDVDRGILLSGPPGCGKTTYAKALAATCNVPLVTGSYGIWQAAGHQGDCLHYMQWCFTAAKRLAPCILFIDEIDSFPDRDKISRGNHNATYVVEIVNAFLAQIDGVGGREGVVIVGATNAPDRVDPAIMRSGRLDRHVRIPLPNAVDRGHIFRRYLDCKLNIDDAVVAASEGMSGADIERCCREARRIARTGKREVTSEDLLQSLPKLHVLSEAERLVAAHHELGHAFVAEALKVSEVLSINISASFAKNAVDINLASIEQRERKMYRDRQAIKDFTCALLGGRAADELLNGGPHNGAQSDLEVATTMLLRLEHKYGLGDTLIYLGEDSSALHLDRALRDKIEKELHIQLVRAKQIIAEHSAVIRKLGKKLAAELTLDPELVRQALKNHKRLVMLQ